MPFVGIIAKFLIARGLSEQRAGPASKALLIVMAVLAAFTGWQLVKHRIIANHDAKREAEVTARQLDRVHTADAVDKELQDKADIDSANVGKVIDDAVDKDPAGGASPAGPVTNAAADELRRQRGKPPSD
jgi:hypothetical protein